MSVGKNFHEADGGETHNNRKHAPAMPARPSAAANTEPNNNNTTIIIINYVSFFSS